MTVESGQSFIERNSLQSIFLETYTGTSKVDLAAYSTKVYIWCYFYALLCVSYENYTYALSCFKCLELRYATYLCSTYICKIFWVMSFVIFMLTEVKNFQKPISLKVSWISVIFWQTKTVKIANCSDDNYTVPEYACTIFI
jgi:hypothetical protein